MKKQRAKNRIPTKVGAGETKMIDKTTDPLEAIKIAIQREQEAHDFYKGHADLFENEATKTMFNFLAGEELKHKQRLQDELDKNYLYEM